MQSSFLLRRDLIAALLVAVLLHPVNAAAGDGAYEAPLPPGINSDPDLCAQVSCTEVLPGASSFSARMGRPAYVEGYRDGPDGREVVGYVFLSTDIVDIPAYSGKPVITLIGMDTRGVLTGVRILRHSEPILLLGIPESVLAQFVDQYVGKFVGDKIEIGRAHAGEDHVGVDAITGATVTVIAQNQVIMRSAVAIARQVGILPAEARVPARFTALDERLGWAQLLREGSVRRLTVRPEQLGMARESEPYIDMYFGYLNVPSVGKSLLGDDAYRSLVSRLAPGEHAIAIVAGGSGSFKGSGFVRGGIFDRIQVVQDADTYTFRDLDYVNLWGLAASGAPPYRESGIFIIRAGSFNAAYPWSLVFLANRLDRATGQRDFVTFSAEYQVPDRYLEGGRPRRVEPEAAWVRIWTMRAGEIALFTALLLFVAVVYALRNHLTRRATHRRKWPVNAFKYSAWVVSVGFVGFGLLAQPSVTQVLTWFHSLLFHWTWELFLSDPFIFIFWVFIIVTVFIWGRGLFCGWLCPFGSLSELLYKVSRVAGLRRLQFRLPPRWHDRLKWLKYAVFFVLLTTSMFSMGLAEKLAEVEPFKTTFLIGMFNRSWPYTLFAAGLLGLSIFIERPFCKYLCPLGAALAIPSTFRWYGLKRKQECASCRACAVGCGSQAIDLNGRIDHRECLHCLDCMVLYTDVHACPPLSQERKRRQRAGLPLTPIGADGYYIPLQAMQNALATATVATGAASAAIDPRLPTDAVAPPYVLQTGWLRWMWLEAWDHLWPWGGNGFRAGPALWGAGVGLAIGAVMVWMLAAEGRLEAVVVLGWWVAWSVFEVAVRLGSKRYVKDGPWWQRNYRVATLMDMLCYVGFKNLLIGAALFLALKSLGLLLLP